MRYLNFNSARCQALLVLAITFLSFNNVTAQTQLVYDYTAGQFVPSKIPRYIKEGSLVSVKYVNLNPFAISATTTLEGIDHSYTDGGSILSNLSGILGKTEEESNEHGEEVAAAPANDGNVNDKDKNGKIPTNKAEKDKKQEKMTELSKKQKEILGEIRYKQVEIGNTINYINDVMNVEQVINIVSADISIVHDTIMKKRIESCLTKDVKDQIGQGDLGDNFYNSINSIGSRLGEIEMLLEQLKKNDAELSALNSKLSIATEIKLLETKVGELKKVYEGDNQKKLRQNVNIIINNLQKLYNTPYEIIADKSTVANTDILTLNFELKDKDGKLLRSNKDIKMYTYKGTRLNTSIGIATTVGPINGKEYNFKKNPTGSTEVADTGRVVLEESDKNRKAAFNPVIFIHYYPTKKGFAYWRALTVGIGPDFADLEKTKLYLGAGFAFSPSSKNSAGVVSRLGLDFGIAAGYADVLKEKYVGYSDYSQFADVDEKDLLGKTLKVGFFVGLSFNLGSVKTESN